MTPAREAPAATAEDVTKSASALLKSLLKYEAQSGCAIVMEVKTGQIHAIANVGFSPGRKYWEDYNYAIGSSTQPGSTFKLAALMALLDDGYVSL